MQYVRSCLRSPRSPIELPEFKTTYQHTRIVVSLLIALSAVVLAGRFDYGPVAMVGLLVCAALILGHALAQAEAPLAVMLSFDTVLYLLMTVLIDLPEMTVFVATTQSFLVFFHVRARTALILMASYMTAGMAAAITTIVIETQRRTPGETAALVVVVTILTAIPSAWLLSQAAAAIYENRDKEEALSKDKDELLVDKDRFVASVSHELRTPLTAVVGLAHTLAEANDTISELEREEFLDLIVTQSEEVAAIVDDLLVAARAGTGHLSLVVGEVDLGEELSSVVPDDVEVLNNEPAPIVVVGDPIRIRQVLRNLVSNCARYGGESKRVRLTRDGFTGIVSVEDSGAPIPVEQAAEIFAAYGRAHDRPGRTDSVGLGLTVSRQLARMMGGDVTYSHNGTWASFTFRLPIAMTELTAAIRAEPASARLAHKVPAR